MFVELKNIFYQNPFLVYVDANSGILYIIDTKKQLWTTIGVAGFYTGIDFREVIWNYLNIYDTYKIQVKENKFFVDNVEELLHLVIIIIMWNGISNFMNNPDSPMSQMMTQMASAYMGVSESEISFGRTCFKQMSENK